ncbi:hypothetical protein K7X08_035726 [Anisodus acutangulus]|uniref:Uncharacterized protein n=1 Tax=Anisodus acutangulus TaxID=402998 RepID=A0A9Q1RI08_9SOLA|nr:hypothetical protein K7X08_035726 [Anisodus acutangulus]
MNELHNVVSHNIDLPIDDKSNDEKQTETNPIDDVEAISMVMETVAKEAEGMEECNKGQAYQHQESSGQLGDKCEVVISNDLMVQESEGQDVVDKTNSETTLIEVRGDVSSLYLGNKEYGLSNIDHANGGIGITGDVQDLGGQDLPIDDKSNDEKKTKTNPLDDAEDISMVMETVSKEAAISPRT